MSSAASMSQRLQRLSPVWNYQKALVTPRRFPRILPIDGVLGLGFLAASSPPPQRSTCSRKVCGGKPFQFSMMSSSRSNERPVVEFRISDSSVLKIQKGDITRWSVDGSSDAIVNPANNRMLGGGGADGAIHDAAGPELKAACFEIPEVKIGVRCPTGEARITPGFGLPASHVIHTVGPIYDSDKNPEASLRNAYRNSLLVAKDNGIQYIAFTAISCGAFGYPCDEAASVAISTVLEFSAEISEVHFVLFSDAIYDAWVEKASELLQN